jgi:hypothetical protein
MISNDTDRSLTLQYQQRSLLTQGAGGGLTSYLSTFYFIRVTIYPRALRQNINRGHYLPHKVKHLVLACQGSIHIRPLSFCHNLANI